MGDIAPRRLPADGGYNEDNIHSRALITSAGVAPAIAHSPGIGPCRPLAIRVDPEQLTTVPPSGLQLGSFSFELTGQDQLWLAVQGEVTGTVGADSPVFLFQRSDPATLDSTPQHHPGDGLYLVKVRLPGPGCFETPSLSLSYSGAKGLSFAFLAAVVPQDALAEVQANMISRAGGHGFTEDYLRRVLRIQPFASAVVGTR